MRPFWALLSLKKSVPRMHEQKGNSMNSDFKPNRYDVIHEKNPREILMLRGSGCKWRRCTFCDYHLDFSRDAEANYALNIQEIQKVAGKYRRLEVINSGSFSDLDEPTIKAIEAICRTKNIHDLHFEMHWMHRLDIPLLRERFRKSGITVHVKMGVETFQIDFRDNILRKGMDFASPEEIAEYADEVCLLFGLTGQTTETMRSDIETGLKLFQRVCVNIMIENSTPVHPDATVIQDFIFKIHPIYKDNPRVDILLDNTDFGVGGEKK